MQHFSLVTAEALPTGMLRTIYRAAAGPTADGETPAAYEDAVEHLPGAEA